MKLQKLGGIAAIASICTYILYRVLLTKVIVTQFGNSYDPVKAITALATAPADFYLLNLVNIINFIISVIFIYVLYDRLKENAPHLARIMLITAFLGAAFPIAGSMMYIKSISLLVPVKDASAYRAIQVAVIGMNTLTDHLWGWVTLLLGCAVLKSKAFSPILGWLSLLTGIMWLSLFLLSPSLYSWVGFLSQGPFIISTIWYGIALLRNKYLEPIGAEQHTRA